MVGAAKCGRQRRAKQYDIMIASASLRNTLIHYPSRL
jgi:hypothetical protein